MLFAVCGLVATVFIGCAIDYASAVSAKTRTASAIDAAVLAAAQIPAAAGATLPTPAQTAAFNSALNAKMGADRTIVSYRGVLTVEPSGAFVGSASAAAALNFARLLGLSHTTLAVTAAANPAQSPSVEIALALDVSGSMKIADLSGVRRIEALKTASAKLIDEASAAVKAPATVKVGYVPFTMNVNIGTANTAYVTGANDPRFAGTQWAGCLLERPVPEHVSNAYDGSAAGPKGKWRAYLNPPEPNNPSYACRVHSNGTNAGYETIDPYVAASPNPWTAGPNYNCTRYAMQPLTTALASIKSQIATLTAELNNGTMFGLGVTWAMRLLTPDAPFSGAAPTGSARKIIVALTDGQQTSEMMFSGNGGCPYAANTVTPYQFDPASLNLSGRALSAGPIDNFSAYGYLLDSDPFGYGYTAVADVDPSLDRLALSACDYVKRNTNIEIFTIAVSNDAGPGNSVYNTLRSCATDADHFFLVTDYTGMISAFESIAKIATRLTLTR